MALEGQRNLYIRGNQPLLAQLKIYMIRFVEDQSFGVLPPINRTGCHAFYGLVG